MLELEGNEGMRDLTESKIWHGREGKQNLTPDTCQVEENYGILLINKKKVVCIDRFIYLFM